MQNNFSQEFFRGISTIDFITPEGYIKAGAFKFSEYDNNLRNGDGFCELSINWNDDEYALTTLLEQHKPFKEEKQFKVGYCVIERTHLDLLLRNLIKNGHFSYERKPILENEEKDIQVNPYHGNLLMLNNLDKNVQKNIQHSLATLAGSIIYRKDL